MKIKQHWLMGLLILVSGFVFLSQHSHAKVSRDQADRLKADLTPVGAERAGNADGSIPEWKQNLELKNGSYSLGAHHPDPFVDDKPVVIITKANLESHKDRLSKGHLALLKHDSFSLSVYPTRRSAIYPQRIYDAIYQNALSATLTSDGEGLAVANASSPFPIPQSAEEVIWNHKMRYRGEVVRTNYGNAVVTSKGRFDITTTDALIQFAYSAPERTPDSQSDLAFMLLGQTTAPAKKAGNKLLVHEFINSMEEPRKSWIKLSGMRRSRRAPDIGYDAPVVISDSIALVDNTDMFSGAMDRFDWNLKGKKELYIPYNAYALHSNQRQYSDILHAKHLNPEWLRYELHRVWVVEATLKKGYRHRYAKRVFYIDEDSWQIAVIEQYDGRGNLMSMAEGHPINYYEKPLFWYTLEVIYDLEKDQYYASGLDNQEKMYDFSVEPKPNYFTPATLTRLR